MVAMRMSNSRRSLNHKLVGLGLADAEEEHLWLVLVFSDSLETLPGSASTRKSSNPN